MKLQEESMDRHVLKGMTALEMSYLKNVSDVTGSLS